MFLSGNNLSDARLLVSAEVDRASRNDKLIGRQNVDALVRLVENVCLADESIL